MVGLEIIKKEYQRAGIATDFDGTISSIRQKSAQASIMPEAKKLLEQLKLKYPLISVISGRPVKQLAQLVGIKGIFYVGNHGAEYLIDTKYRVEKDARNAAPLLANIFRKLQAQKQEFDLDYKKFSLSIHYRSHPRPAEIEKKLEKIFKQYVNQGLKITRGRKVFDISAQNIDKGNAVQYLIDKYELKYFVYVGDDRTDIDAFDKMTFLAKRGIKTLKIALDSHEAPAGLMEKSDLRITSIQELLDLFKKLL